MTKPIRRSFKSLNITISEFVLKYLSNIVAPAKMVLIYAATIILYY
jgi:hypothetical protein